ncbi:translocation/assembly module TamB domain-containing protein [Hydrogenophaga sp.]|uniref:translocation/assembly module TamB domain-containing protein n=1 Tax=Hydrogenophaga sp. TaxID=1904254 RepID=UPI00272F5A86|nr:translocation/assembly module TamB domain-containing protein [Hydrogenophaga sp.]MDP2074001.1 translocation/assembly module TamB domain-containing protein [Hydrogenophaga sp.]MDP3108012.1 translocation/assembly module TamB domain-containing protein [Hydrogenophaga sp.]
MSEAPAQPTRTRRALGGLGWFVLWLPGALLGLVMAAAIAAWVWAGTAGSLAQAIGWGQSYMADQGESAGTLTVSEVQGSLRNGGEIGRLQWQRDELIVQATRVRIALDNRFWFDALLARGLRLSQFDIGRLQITDRRPPTPVEPLQPITLPMAVTLPWSVGELVLDGKQEVSLSGLKGQYRYRPADSLWNLGVADAHQLDLANLQVAGGLYQIQAVLGAQAPMPLRVDAQGEVKATVPGGEDLVLKAIAKVTGQLAESDAALDATASITTSTASATDAPVLDASARIRPWKTQPIETANARMNRLNLAALWPQAPVTELSGTVVAQPDGDAWRAQVRVTNAVPGPADKQRLPLQSLQADLEQRGARWTLSNLDALLGGGRVLGQAWREPAASPLGDFQGELKASRINPAALWSSIAPAALDGTLSARAVNAESANPAIDLNAVVKPSGTQPKAGQLAGLRLRDLNLQGRWTPQPDNAALGVLDLRTLSAGMADATLDGQGQLEVGARRFDGRLALKLPGAQADWQGRVAHAQGKGEFNLALDDAARVLAWVKSLQTLPVLGPLLRAQLEAMPGLQAEGNARLTASWDGGLGVLGYPAPVTGATTAAPPRVQARLQAPRLVIARGTAARAADPATGTDAVVGTLQTMSLANLNLQARGLPHQLDITATGQAEQGPWRATLDTQGRLQMGSAQRPDIDSGRLDLTRLQLRATDSARKDRVVDWTLQSVAALGLRWQDARSAINLQADAGQLRLQPSFGNRAGAAATAATNPMTVAWDQLSWQRGALATRGQLTGLPLSWVDAFTTAEGAKSGPLSQAGLGGDVVFDGSWDFLLPADAATPPRLTAQLQRRSGDLSVQTDGAFDENTTSTQRLQSGIKEARLSVTTQGANVQASLRWDSERLGTVSAELGTTLSPPGGEQTAWHWAENAPLRGTVTANLPQVGVWSALAPPGWRVRGTLAASATLSGTRDTPLWNGTLRADQLALRSIVNGISFSRGELRATLAGERITIDRFYLQGGGGVETGGTLLASGTTEFRRITVDGVSQRQPYINLQATATRLRVSSRADRRLTLSGQLQAELVGTALQIRGGLKADSALFVLPDESTPSLGADVVVRGTETALETPGAFRVRPDVLIDIDLGDDFQVSGQGLQTRLAGQINVRSTPELPTPRVLGDVRTERGSYRAYGQRLTIENGVLRFTGPYDNPTLDITAVRPNTSQRVGVQISGTAQVPRVRLFSDPELPDSEKLAWLVLGRPASGAGAEAAVLQQAALALLAGRDGRLDGGLAAALGLDEVSFAGRATNADGSAASAALTLGKRLSNNLYLSYERSLAGALGTVSIFYDVSRRLTVRARAGEENALDLIFTIQYD